MRVQIATKGAYRYPDIVIYCGEPEFADDQFDTLLNPIVLVEVLSDTSQKRDMGTKLQEYTQIDSLQEYLIVEQDKMRVYHYTRDEEKGWRINFIEGEKAMLNLASIDYQITLEDLYEGVKFDDNPESDAD